MLNINGSLVVAVKPKAEYEICVSFMFLFYIILKKNYPHKELQFFSKLAHHVSRSFIEFR
jgi:hypothetical protein